MTIEASDQRCVPRPVTLERWELSDRPTGADCQIGSAELTLRRTIARLHDINGRVLFDHRKREVAHGT